MRAPREPQLFHVSARLAVISHSHRDHAATSSFSSSPSIHRQAESRRRELFLSPWFESLVQRPQQPFLHCRFSSTLRSPQQRIAKQLFAKR
jgi:hypothetical protein